MLVAARESVAICLLYDASMKSFHLRATIRRVSIVRFQYEKENNVRDERGGRIDPTVVDVEPAIDTLVATQKQRNESKTKTKRPAHQKRN